MNKSSIKSKFMCLITAIIFIASGCGSSGFGSKSKSSDQTKANVTENAVSKESNGIAQTNDTSKSLDSVQKKSLNLPESEKIILTSNIEMESTKFDESVNDITEKTKELNGYIENSSIQGNRINSSPNASRYATFTLRIPKQNYQTFMDSTSNFGNVISISSSTENITDEYYDTDAHLKALKVQEERLLELLRKATSLTDILKIEDKLTDVRYKIESLEGSIRRMDKLVEYSTITVRIREVHKITVNNPTLLTKMKDAFTSSIATIILLFKGLAIAVSAIIPFLPLAAVAFGIFWFKIKKTNNKK